jgi:predicted transposase/invertase (TIGR01784 family)
MSGLYRARFHSIKHSFSSTTDKSIQIFSRPTYDRIAKYILSQDESVRVDILRAFTGIQSLSSAKQIDEHYNPFDSLSEIRNFINSKPAENFFKSVNKSSLVEISLDSKKNKQASEVLKRLCSLSGDLSYAFPNQRNRSTVDFLCETDSGYITIEFQVAKKDYWDKRALAYIATIYGNQLRRGDKYDQINNVIGINLLGDGSVPYWNDGKFIRNYTLVDEANSKNKITSLRLIQYSLGDVDLSHKDLKKNKKLRQWIDFFKSAHNKKSPPPSIDDPVKKAYEMIRVDNLKAQRPDLLQSSDEFFLQLTEHNKAVEEIGKEIGKEMVQIVIARNLLKAGSSVTFVASSTGLSEEKVQSLI